jgi:hypothetical protein
VISNAEEGECGMRKVGLVLLGILLTGIFLNVWMIPVAFVFQFVAGLKGTVIFQIEYCVALVLAIVSTVLVIRPLWNSKPKPPKSAAAT